MRLTRHSSWGFRCPPDTADVQASSLGGEMRSASYSADFNGRHGDAHVQTLAVLLYQEESVIPGCDPSRRLTITKKKNVVSYLSVLHDGHAVTALYVLGRILAGGEEYGCHDVRGMCVESTNRSYTVIDACSQWRATFLTLICSSYLYQVF